MRRFLLVSPYFAPQAALGAYRWVKLARHLPDHGWLATVLAATFPEDARDEGLLDALPAGVEVVEGYLDPRILALRDRLRREPPARAHRPRPPAAPIQGLAPTRVLTDRCTAHVLHAASSGAALARRSGARVVVVSAGPFSACEVGLRVARATGLPLVYDLRDPFSVHESRARAHGLGAAVRGRIVDALERRWIGAAAAVILNTRRAFDAYAARYPEAAGRMTFVRNHFDPTLYRSAAGPAADRDGSRRAASERRFVVLHLGALRADTRVDDVAQAVLRVAAQRGLGPDRIVLRQIGRVTDFERRRVAELGAERFFEALAPVSHRDVMTQLRAAHVLVSMVAPGIDLRIAAKTYDYLASGRPIVAVATNPELDELFAMSRGHVRVAPGDVGAVAEAIDAHVERWLATGRPADESPAPAALTSAVAAASIAAVLDRVSLAPPEVGR